jgi:ferrous iron transport protein A
LTRFKSPDMTADKLLKGGFALIESIIEPDLSLYCQDLGLLPGKKVQLLHKAPFGGPLAFQFGNTTISLRKDEARYIKVRALESEETRSSI